MNEPKLRDMLTRFQDGTVDLETVVSELRRLPFEDVMSSVDKGCITARVDHHRELRCGFGEVIFCMGKSVSQVSDIFAKLAATGQNVLATRATREMFDAVATNFPSAEFHETARTIALVQNQIEPVGNVAIVAAGTSDLPVAEEARITAEIMGANVTTHYDMGVAGLHRLLADMPEIREAKVLVAVAGMEGALASVVGGLVSVPVIAVPTSVGYGASFAGLAALLAMLNSCAAGVSVVNIDNGFGAGYNAALINRT
ncbi:MAG: nickel pincer cofactor biosynthesis protein LarB [Phycisphaerae bacterium]|nr:nickel pincer cofactor biosynthesis protein LarB [Phycisphaerae bacterium]